MIRALIAIYQNDGLSKSAICGRLNTNSVPWKDLESADLIVMSAVHQDGRFRQYPRMAVSLTPRGIEVTRYILAADQLLREVED